MDSYAFDAVIFDMDGILTKTAIVHAEAWKLVFDEYLQLRQKRSNEPFREFELPNDYLTYVDGKPRAKGISSFLESRGIHLPLGLPEDPLEAETIYAIGNKKNNKFRQVLETEGVQVYSSTIELIEELKKLGFKVGVVSSSKNCQYILESAKILDLFQTRVDGVVAQEMGLEGKPEGDIFVEAALKLGTTPDRSVVVEDAISGVQAGRNGGFGLVIGVARSNNELELQRNGADVVVKDLADLDIKWIQKWFCRKPIPLFEAWENRKKIEEFYAQFQADNPKVIINYNYLRDLKSIFSSQNNIVFFLDYDGTLTPIVDRPELAVISDAMKNVVRKIADKFTTAIVSGRMREDVENLVGIKGLFYAGSHGFDILGRGISMVQSKAKETMPIVNKVINQLKNEIGAIEGVIIEEKKFSVAVHYRLVKEQYLSKISEAVQRIVGENSVLRMMSGKKVYEILPAIDWNKGKAVRWIMQALGLTWEDSSVIYIGDDTTDEDAFRAVRSRGVGILVSSVPRESSADFQLSSPDETRKLFEMLVASS